MILAGVAIAPLAVNAQANAKIKLGVFSSENGAEAFYAKDMGFFAKAGVEIDYQTMQGDPATVAAVVSGALDIGFSNVGTLALVHTKGISSIIIAPAGEISADTMRIAAVLVPPDSSIRAAKDLNGKRVGIATLHSLPYIATCAWIDRNGGDSSTIKFVEIPLPTMPAALDAGRVDGAWISEPFLSIAKRKDRIIGFPYGAIGQHFLTSVWFTTPQWAADHPELVKSFGDIIHQTAQWANRNQDRSGEILAKYTKIDLATIATMTRSRYGEELTPALMQPLIDAAARYNGFASFPAKELLLQRSH